VVIYSGHDSKIMMNSIKGKMKYSRVERNMNRYIVYVFVYLFFECMFASAYYNIWYEGNKS
jgi:phospholipid-transporting ATPase